MSADPRQLLPRNKSDEERVRALIALGYPAVAPVLPDLLEWLQDGNWPISRPIADFFLSIGEPVLPLIDAVLRGPDATWKYWCIQRLIARLPPTLAAGFRPELERLAQRPTGDEQSEELYDVARDALVALWPPESEVARVAMAFVEALVRGDWPAAHAMLAPPLRDQCPPGALHRQYAAMTSYWDKPPESLKLASADSERAYVALYSTSETVGTVQEGVDVSVVRQDGRWLIDDIVWGRP
jgi:hypothetical protein